MRTPLNTQRLSSMNLINSKTVTASLGVVIISAATLQSINQPSVASYGYRWDAHDDVFRAVSDKQSQMLAIDPRNPQRWGEMGMLLMAHGDLENSLPFLKTAANLSKDSSRWNSLLSLCYQLTQEPDKALIHAEKASRSAPPNEAWHSLLYAELCFEQGDTETSQKVTERLIKIHPQNPRIHSLLGLLYKEQGQLELAKHHLTLSQRNAPYQKTTASKLAETYALLGQKKESNQQAEIAKQLESVPWRDPVRESINASVISKQKLLDRLSHELRISNTPAAQRTMNLLLRFHPDAHETQERYAFFLVEAQQYSDAAQVLRKTLSANPKSVASHYYLGRCLFETGKLPDCKNIVEAGLQLDPADRYLQLLQAELTCVTQDKATASAMLRNLISREPLFAAPHRILSLILMSDGKLNEALGEVNQGLEKDPQSKLLREMRTEVLQLING